MVRLALRSLRAHTARLLLSSLGIVLGVAFIAGSLMFADGLKSAMTDLATAQYRNTDVQASPSGEPFPADIVDRIRAVPGVQAAEGSNTASYFGIATQDGRRVPGYPSAVSLPVDPALRMLDARRGRLPAAPGEIVLDERTADREKIRIGDEVHIGSYYAPAKPYRLVGLVGSAGDALAVQAVFVGMVPADTMALAQADTPDEVVVAAADGVGNAELADRIRSAVGGRVQTHQELLEDALDRAVGDSMTFKMALGGFGIIAVFVAAFVIANTFTIVLAQRTRETALLRLVGATRRQVFRSLVIEAAATGLLGSLLGLLVGVGLSYGLRAAFAAMGSALSPPLVVTGTTVAISMAVGTGVTVLAALLPARRGTAVAPVAALSDAAVQPAHRPGRARRAIGALTAALGVASLAAAGQNGEISLIVAGTLLGFTGFLILSPTVVPAIVRAIGWPATRLGGAAGALAVVNAVRNPRRIAATTNALVIGVALVSTFTLVAESAKAPAEHKADVKLGTRFLLTNGEAFSSLPESLLDALRRQPQLGLIHPQYELPGTDGADSSASSGSSDSSGSLGSSGSSKKTVSREADPGLDGPMAGVTVYSGHPALLRHTYPRHDGSVARLVDGTAVVTAKAGAGLGSTITVRGRSFRVVAVVPPNEDADVDDRSVWLTPHDVKALDPDLDPGEVYVDPAPGVPAAAARAAIDRLIRDYPTMIVYDHAAYVTMLNAQIQRTLAMVTGLLALAVIIALIGVANTLTLSVLERTRENALLRAIGLTRRQLRGTLAVEAVVMALSGTLLGVAAATGISSTVLHAIGTHGADLPLVMPWDRLGILLAVATLAALAASVFPAHKAARRPVVENLAAD